MCKFVWVMFLADSMPQQTLFGVAFLLGRQFDQWETCSCTLGWAEYDPILIQSCCCFFEVWKSVGFDNLLF